MKAILPRHKRFKYFNSSPSSSSPVMETPGYESHAGDSRDIDGIWQDALDQYRRSLPHDLNKLSERILGDLEACLTTAQIIDALEKTSESLDKRRNGNGLLSRLRAVLKPLVYGLSAILEAMGETASTHVPGGKGIFVAVAILLKAAENVSAAFDDLERLLQRLQSFVERLTIRVHAPMKDGSRSVAVRALVKTLKAVDLATRLIQRGRMRLFVRALFTKHDEVTAALLSLEDVTTDEERMTIAELSVDMDKLTYAVRGVETSVSSLQGMTGATHMAVKDMYKMIQEMNNRLMNVQSFVAVDASLRPQLETVTSADTASSASTRQVATLRCVPDWFSLGRLIRRTVGRFCSEDQDIIWRAFATIFTWAIDAISIGDGNGGTVRSVAVVMTEYTQIAQITVRMAAMFLLLFMLWRLSSVSRPLGPFPDRITIVDVLGEVLVLGPDTFSTWENTHTFLLQAFQGRLGASYVKRRAYGLGNDEHPLIQPQSWSSLVHPGLTLDMSIMVRERTPRCPYCYAARSGNETEIYDGRILCSEIGCRRIYSTHIDSHTDHDSLHALSDSRAPTETPHMPGSLVEEVDSPSADPVADGVSPLSSSQIQPLSSEATTSSMLLSGPSVDIPGAPRTSRLQQDMTQRFDTIEDTTVDQMSPYRRIIVQIVQIPAPEVNTIFEIGDSEVDNVVSCILGDPAILSRGNARPEESSLQDSLIQALVIGIDQYQEAPPINNLTGAVADAKSMYEYLHHELNVPAEQIVKLHNKDATRDAILKQIRALSTRRRTTSSSRSVPVKKGDPIIIYFAGHGASGKAPDGWVTETGNVSMLVPYDGSPKDASRNILDRTIGALLHELAEGGQNSSGLGDNITVIFDCCHSGSGTRKLELEHATPHLERGFELDADTVIPPNLDEDIWGVVYNGRSTDTPSGFAFSGTRSHVLLAACRESEKAYESYCRGIFTQTLLAELRRIKTDKITYQGLMQRVVKPISNQNPQCEGHNSDRLLFDALAPSAGRTVYDFVKKDDKYVLHAGSLHGVTKGAEFKIYPSPDFTASDPPLTTIAVKAVKAFTCRPRDDVPELPSSLLYAHQISMGQAEALRLYISSSDVLRPVITAFAEEIQPQKEVENRILLGSKAEADISLESEPSGVRFHVHDSLIKSYGLEKLSQRVPPEPHRIRAVLRAASHFLWHLRHEPPSTKHRLRDRVDIAFHKVEKGNELDSSLRKMWK
ncbi:unnamed protein product, partial [Peniophora sp. CBMAI 1063]